MEKEPNRLRWFQAIVLLSICIASLIAFFQLVQLPSEGTIFGRFTTERLLMLAGIVLSWAISGFGFVAALKGLPFLPGLLSRLWSKKIRFELLLFVVSLVGMLAWSWLWKPLEDVGRFAAYLQRLKPVLLVVVSWSVGILLLLGCQLQFTLNNLNSYLQQNKIVLICFTILLGLAGFLSLTGLGITDDGAIWNVPGMPILTEQIMVVLFVVFWLFRWGKRLFLERIEFSWADGVLLTLIVAATAVWWILTPQPSTIFAPGPYYPNEEVYPFIDSADYDRNAIYALVGEGLGNQKYVDKPLYVVFLFCLHVIAGIDNYAVLTGIQAGLFAVFPAILYLLGKYLHDRFSSVLTAVLGAVWGRNLIAGAGLVNGGSPKLVMTEFFSAILFAVIVLVFLRYLQKKKPIHLLVILSGLLALAVMARLNFWFLPFFVSLVLLAAFWKQRDLWKNLAIFVVVFLLLISPWMIRDIVKLGEIGLVNNVLQRSIERLLEIPGEVVNRFSPIHYGQTDPTAAGAHPVYMFPDSWVGIEKDVFKESIPVIVLNHAFHNIISAFLTVPRSFTTASLDTLIRAEGSVWQMDGCLHFSATETVWLLAHLLILSLGFAAVWKRHHWIGLLPAGLMMGYALGLGFARTSGDRYITPIVGIFLLYWSIGVVQVFSWILGRKSSEVAEKGPANANHSWKKAVIWFAVFLILASAPVWVDWIIPEKLTEPTYEQTVAIMASDLQAAGFRFGENDIKKFIHLEDSIFRYGVIYAPRWLAAEQGGNHPDGLYRSRSYDRLVFELLGKQAMYGGLLPIQSVALQPVPHGGQALYLGCKLANQEELVLAVKIWNADGQELFYVAEGLTTLDCESLP